LTPTISWSSDVAVLLFGLVWVQMLSVTIN